jgi:hypothetical protein
MSDQSVTTRSGWGGWIVFAAIMLMIGGALNAFYGVVALVDDEWVVWSNQGNLYIDLTDWGWIHLILGCVVALAGLALFSGNILARIVAVVVAGLSIAANFLFMPAYPLWSLTVITIDVLVIYAVTAHGRDVEAWGGNVG